MKRQKKETAVRAAGYVRVSTDEQVTEGQSLDNQIARVRAYADSQAWELTDVYKEEGYSGKVIDRPELARLIADIKAGKIDVVLVYKVDRLTRKQLDLWHLLENVFEANNVGFKSVVEPFDTTTAQGKAFLGMLAVFAQLERDTIAERTRDTLANKRANGEWTGRIPFGYRMGDNGKLEKDAGEQRVITQVRRLHRQGLSYRSIADKVGLNFMTVSRLVNGNGNSRNARYLGGLARESVT